MKKIFLLATIFFAIASCHNKSSDAAEKDSYEMTKETLKEKESKSPAKFLSVTSKDKHNLLGQMVVKGLVTNNAKICTYKDVELELSFYSKTGALLEKDNETVYESIAPGNSSSFKTKYFAPKGSDSVGIKVLSAKTE